MLQMCLQKLAKQQGQKQTNKKTITKKHKEAWHQSQGRVGVKYQH